MLRAYKRLTGNIATSILSFSVIQVGCGDGAKEVLDSLTNLVLKSKIAGLSPTVVEEMVSQVNRGRILRCHTLVDEDRTSLSITISRRVYGAGSSSLRLHYVPFKGAWIGLGASLLFSCNLEEVVYKVGGRYQFDRIFR